MNIYFNYRSFHKGVKYECLGCKKQFTNRDNFALHQKTTGHTGEGIVETPEQNESRNQDLPPVAEVNLIEKRTENLIFAIEKLVSCFAKALNSTEISFVDFKKC